MLRAIRNLGRLARIALTLARYDALAAFSHAGLPPALLWFANRMPARRGAGRPGERLAAAFTALGPSFIKLGQALSIRADIVGEEVAADLSQLQDKLPPFPTAQARATVAAELGQPIEALFRSFDDQPVAAASIAQVHFAVDAATAATSRSRSCGPASRRSSRATSTCSCGSPSGSSATRRGCAASSRSRSSPPWRRACGSRWTCASRPPRPRSSAQNFAGDTDLARAEGRLGAHRRAAC